jgi:hypothetical protein
MKDLGEDVTNMEHHISRHKMPSNVGQCFESQWEGLTLKERS